MLVVVSGGQWWPRLLHRRETHGTGAVANMNPISEIRYWHISLTVYSRECDM